MPISFVDRIELTWEEKREKRRLDKLQAKKDVRKLNRAGWVYLVVYKGWTHPESSICPTGIFYSREEAIATIKEKDPYVKYIPRS